ncbi:hypothetical protein AwWohl_03830 [Gammaproteobacteria bacterium]|nr:hypothetical protein AwWohl_03830 [Gammaproteobacteria bacterium]
MTLDKHLNILLVDDSATARVSIISLIKDQDININIAENGIDAIAQIQEHKPDLILLDISMPVWGGLSVLSVLKNTPLTQHIPVIILSAKDGLHDKAEVLLLGASDFILKPCKKHTLLDAIALCS